VTEFETNRYLSRIADALEQIASDTSRLVEIEEAQAVCEIKEAGPTEADPVE